MTAIRAVDVHIAIIDKPLTCLRVEQGQHDYAPAWGMLNNQPLCQQCFADELPARIAGLPIKVSA